MKITSFRPKRGGGRRVGMFNAEIENICLSNLTLIRKPDGEVRVFGEDIEAFFNSLAHAALNHSDAVRD